MQVLSGKTVSRQQPHQATGLSCIYGVEFKLQS